jgi:diguanylate cyclase (GGDEF)-like protein
MLSMEPSPRRPAHRLSRLNRESGAAAEPPDGALGFEQASGPDPGAGVRDVSERQLSNSDQTAADGDQTLSDTDQTSSDSDQTAADNDQIAADRDQAASDRDLAAGVDPRDHEITRDIRQHTTEQRERSARVRLDAASARDSVAQSRDLAALARDNAAAARDLAMAQREAASDPPPGRGDFGVEVLMRAADQRKRAAEYRVLAAEHRELAAEDRLAAAEDREQAASERLRALADREILAAELAMAETDELTGARTRAAGLSDLDRELDRCRRTGSVFVVAYIDVVGLKQLNETLGHSAGDELLVDVATLIRQHLRSYDLMVRIGGDEFLCAISGMSEATVRQRFSEIGSALATRPDAGGIRTGFATLHEDETAAQVIRRADAELIRPLRQRPSNRAYVNEPDHDGI